MRPVEEEGRRSAKRAGELLLIGFGIVPIVEGRAEYVVGTKESPNPFAVEEAEEEEDLIPLNESANPFIRCESTSDALGLPPLEVATGVIAADVAGRDGRPRRIGEIASLGSRGGGEMY